MVFPKFCEMARHMFAENSFPRLRNISKIEPEILLTIFRHRDLDCTFYNISRFRDCFSKVFSETLNFIKKIPRLREARFKLQEFEILDKICEIRKISGTIRHPIYAHFPKLYRDFSHVVAIINKMHVEPPCR